MKRRIIKKSQKGLINKRALNYIIEHSNICRHAKAELKRAGYGTGKAALMTGCTNKLWKLLHYLVLIVIVVFLLLVKLILLRNYVVLI